MNNPVVLDACTIVNLARIDEEDFLEDKIKELKNVFAVGKVIEEVKERYLPSDRKSKRKLHILPYWGGLTKYEDDSIKEEANSVKAFLDYPKKPNGELYSAALSLFLSRLKDEKVLFYTDDYPAKEDFEPFFGFQQLGYIGDSVDLLVFLYWTSSEGKFSIDELKKYLTALRAEYMIMLNDLQKGLNDYADTLSSTKKDRSRKFAIEKLANDLMSGMALGDVIKKCVKLFEKDRSAKGKKIIQILSTIKSSPEIVKKIDTTLRNISQYGIFK